MLGCSPSSLLTVFPAQSSLNPNPPTYHQRFPVWKLTVKFLTYGPELLAPDSSNHSLFCTNNVRLQDVVFVYSSICYHSVLVSKQNQASSQENYWIVAETGHNCVPVWPLQFSTCVEVAARVIGMATHYRLDSPSINFQLSKVFCAIYTVPKAYLASSTMDTGSFLGVKWPGHGADQPSPSAARLQIVWTYNSLFRLCRHRLVLGWPLLLLQFWQVSCLLHVYKFTLLLQQFWQVSCVLHVYKFTLLLQQFWQVSCVLHVYKFTVLLQQFWQVSCVLHMYKFTLLLQQFWQVSCALHIYKFTLLLQQFWQVSCVLHMYNFTLLLQQFWQVSCVLHIYKFTLLLRQLWQVSCVLHVHKFTLLLQQFWQVSCVLHIYKFTLLHQSYPQNKTEKQKLARFEHAPITWGASQTRDKTRNFPQTDIRSLNSTEGPSCCAWKREAQPRLIFWKFIQHKIMCPHIRRSGDSVLCPKMERRRVSAEGRFCIGETTCTKIHTTEVYRLKVHYRCAH